MYVVAKAFQVKNPSCPHRRNKYVCLLNKVGDFCRKSSDFFFFPHHKLQAYLYGLDTLFSFSFFLEEDLLSSLYSLKCCAKIGLS